MLGLTDLHMIFAKIGSEDFWTFPSRFKRTPNTFDLHLGRSHCLIQKLPRDTPEGSKYVKWTSIIFPSRQQCFSYDPSVQGSRLDTPFRCTRQTALGHSTPCSHCCLALPSSVRQSWRCGHRIVTWHKTDVILVFPRFLHPILRESVLISHLFWTEEMALDRFPFQRPF